SVALGSRETMRSESGVVSIGGPFGDAVRCMRIGELYGHMLAHIRVRGHGTNVPNPGAEGTMKTLLVLRHAKSDRSDPGIVDHDRPLAPRGETAAPRMGAAPAALGNVPDAIVTSPAVRARDTARLAATGMGYDGPITETRVMYAAA